MKRFPVIVTIAIFAGVTVAHAQFGSGVVYDPTQSVSTFLGHVDPTSTSVYLTITEELLNLAAQRFQGLAPKGGAQ